MLKLFLTVTVALCAINAAHAADSASAPTQSTSCRVTRAAVEDRQRAIVDGAFHFVDGDNMVCFRPPQSGRPALKTNLPDAPQSGTITRPNKPPLPQPNIVTRTPPLPQPPNPWTPGSNVAGDGGAADKIFRGSIAFKTGHVIPLTKTAELGTRVGGNVSNGLVTFNSFEFRLGQRF